MSQRKMEVNLSFLFHDRHVRAEVIVTDDGKVIRHVGEDIPYDDEMTAEDAVEEVRKGLLEELGEIPAGLKISRSGIEDVT